MPVVLRAHGLRFMIYLEDHPPAHVHVIGGGTAKIQFADGVVETIWNRGLTRADIKKALDAVELEQDVLLDTWKRIHG